MTDDAQMLYYDADGNQASKDDASATRQYLSDDPARPDAAKEAKATKAISAPPENKAVANDAEENKAL